MKLVFVHGWSVTHTDTYGSLPQILAARAAGRGLSLELVDIWLGRYISFHNEVRMDDVARAFQQALLDALPDGKGGVQPFSCITHSTGGPVVRSWIHRYFAPAELAACPLRHLIMLAPANHGSALAILGTSRVGRLKSWFDGIEPGAGILRWLELGSEPARALNRAWLDYDPLAPGSEFRPFVLTGETIDKKLYDYINSYTGEVGSDGVVRVAAANLDYSWLSLSEDGAEVAMTGELDRDGRPKIASLLRYNKDLRVSKPCPFLVVPDASHSGERIGIMRSPTLENADNKPVVAAILAALSVTSRRAYAELATEWARATANVQSGAARRRRFFQMIIRVFDDHGYPVTDYDFILLAGDRYDPDRLPKGFFVDKQPNRHAPQTITFYLDFDVMTAVRDGRFGFRIVARPNAGFAYYRPVEFHADRGTLDTFVDPNTTLYIDITLRRHVDRETARLDPATRGPQDFTDVKPANGEVP
ncbi:MAG TPA: hypothetical protein VGD81_12835 [Opitutaceae bacterium]